MSRELSTRHSGAPQVLVVGAGPAGLSCAGLLVEQGVPVRLLEKSRGVGGRCATRRLAGQPVDHGVAFYHGDDPDFVSALRSVESEAPFDWPQRVVGYGAACQPRAFRANEQRFAFAGGVSVFPKQLAKGLPIEFETRASRIHTDGDSLAVATEPGRRYRARSLVLALPAGQTLDLLQTLAPEVSGDLPVARELLAGLSTVRCLTLIAGYPAGIPAPEWDVCYPQQSDILQMVSQDSTKRGGSAPPVLVFQGRPRWSTARWDEEPADWTAALLAEAGTVCGDWATRPAWTDTQRWRYARLSGGDALTAPLLLRLTNGSTIGIAGEAMAEGGGVQAAWLSGRRLARRLLGDSER